MNEDILLDKDNGAIWTITLNRPHALNAITMAMAAQLEQILTDAAGDNRTRCLIVTGVGDDAFSAGFDIKEMAGFDSEAMRDAFIQRDALFKKIALHPLPVIVALNGKAFGAGALIAAAADFRIARSNATFKVTAINYGSANATWTLPRLVGVSHAKHILMTGRVVDAEEGLKIGLFDELVKDDCLIEAAIKLANIIAAKPMAGIAAVKRLVNAAPHISMSEGWIAEHAHMLEELESRQQGGAHVFNTFLGKV